MRAKLSILGLYWRKPDIFDNFKLPTGVDRDTLIPELLAELAELEILYADPDTMKTLIGVWSERRLYAWDKLYQTTKFEYNPIWNKDGTVTETETRDLDADELQTRNLKSESSASGSTDGQTNNYTYGYNSGTAANHDKSVDHSESESSGTGKDTGTVSNARGETERITRERVEKGNIGVTTTQAMIREERGIADFDIYQYIINDFKDRFCLLVY